MNNKIITAIAAVLLTACAQQAPEDPNNITSKFTGTFNIYEKFVTNDDGSITYTSIPWGGLVGNVKERNMPVDWSGYESVTFEFAAPSEVETQIYVSEKLKTYGRKGISSLTCYFDGQDVTSVSEVALQTADSTTITVKKVYLTPGGAVWDSTPIWTGDCQFRNWENGFVIKPELFESAIEGDKIEFVFTTDTSNPDIGYFQFKTVYNDGTNNTLEGNYSQLNNWGCANVGKEATIYRIVLTGKDVMTLKQKGMFVNGFMVNCTQCNLLRKYYKAS